MRNLIKKILKESEDDFEWVKDIPSTNIEVLGGEYMDQYINGNNLRLTSMLNTLYREGVDTATEVMDNVGGHIIDNLGYDKLHISPQYRSETYFKNNNRWAFTVYFTSLMDGDVLRDTFRLPIYHDNFGEGGDDFYDLQDRSYASYFLRIDGTIIHVGYDHRGTRIELPENTSSLDLIRILKTLFDETSIHIK